MSGVPVLVIGMHRSGTSLLARMLHLSGIFAGEAGALVPARPDNPEGYFEHLGFVEINEDLLSRAGAAWDCPPVTGFDWRGLADDESLHDRAVMLAASFADRDAWLLKDPRATLTLPFWQSVLAGARVVLCVRNPLEVSTSLRTRGYSSHTFGLRLWHVYNAAVLHGVRHGSILVSHYERMLSDPAGELRRIFRHAGLPEPPSHGAGHVGTEQLRHTSLRLRDLMETRVSPPIVRLYLELCDAAGWTDESGAAAEMALRDTPGNPDNDELPATVLVDGAAADRLRHR